MPRTNGAVSALAPKPRRTSARPDMRALLDQALHPGDDDADSRSIDDIIEGLKLLDANREIYEEADRYYQGDLGMVWASDRIQRMFARQNMEDLRDFNYAAIPVDRIAARLQISSVVAAPAEENDGEEATGEDASSKTANKHIAQLRKDNKLDVEEKRLHKLVSRYGEAYVLVWPGVDADGKPTVDMRVNSPYDVVMVYDEEDQLRARYVLKSWTVNVGGDSRGGGHQGKTITRANLYYPDRIERWTTEAGGSPEKRDGWFRLDDIDEPGAATNPEGAVGDFGDFDDDEITALAADEFTDERDVLDGEAELDLGDIPNPWNRLPWLHFRNDSPRGMPEHRNAYGPQQLINKLIWGLAGTIDYATFPQRYLLMDPMADDPMGNLTDPQHPDLDDDDVENEGGNAGLDATPGALWKLWGKSVGEFTPASITGFLDSLAQIVGCMGDLTGLPQYLFSRKSAEIPSGESFREANGDFIALIGDRQDRYDPVWQDAYELALRMLGIVNVSVDVRWKPAQVVNDSAGWSVIGMKINAGVPPEVVLEEAGYAPEQVDEWLKDATGADLGRRVALLNQIATATQALGASIVTGAVSAAQVQALIGALFKDTMAGTEFALPSADDFVDPQAALKAQQDMQDKQLQHAGGVQEKQLDHATQAQQTAHDNARQMAEEGHRRMQETMAASGAVPSGGQKKTQPAKKAARGAAGPRQ